MNLSIRRIMSVSDNNHSGFHTLIALLRAQIPRECMTLNVTVNIVASPNSVPYIRVQPHGVGYLCSGVCN